MDNIIVTPITEAARLEAMKPDAGIEDGAVVVSPAHESEKIVHDTDENNNVIGWHKEPVQEGTN